MANPNIVVAAPAPSAQSALEEANARIKALEAKLAVGAEMTNIVTKLDGSVLTIVMDLSQSHGASSTGKTLTVASTHGNRIFAVGDRKVFVGVNAYVKA